MRDSYTASPFYGYDMRMQYDVYLIGRWTFLLNICRNELQLVAGQYLVNGGVLREERWTQTETDREGGVVET